MGVVKAIGRGRLCLSAASLALFALVLAACGSSNPTASGSTSGGHVLLVGTFDGHRGEFKTIQSAVKVATPGDWILVAPGDYHETADESGGWMDPSDGDIVVSDASHWSFAKTGLVNGSKLAVVGNPDSCQCGPCFRRPRGLAKVSC